MLLYLILALLSTIVLLISIVVIIRLRLYRRDGKYGRRGIFFSTIVGVLLISGCVGAIYLITGPFGSLLFGGSTGSTSNDKASPPSEPTPIRTTNVIVALQPLDRGAEFVQGSVGRRPWPADNVPPDIIADESELFGKVAKTNIIQGQVIARTMLIDRSGLKFFPAPVVANGVAYFGRNDGQLYALETDTGQELWRFQVGSGVFSTPAVAEGVLYLADGWGSLYALDAQTGRELWRITDVDQTYKLEPASPIVVGDVVYFENRSDGYFYAINAQTGQEIWRYDQVGTAIVADGRVYFMLGDGAVSTILDMETGQPVDLESAGEN